MFDKIPPNKIRVIYNGIDIEKFTININKKAIRSLLGLPENKILVGTLGRLTKQKGIEYLIKALEKIDVSLVIGGNGPLKNDLKALAKSLKIDSYFFRQS